MAELLGIFRPTVRHNPPKGMDFGSHSPTITPKLPRGVVEWRRSLTSETATGRTFMLGASVGTRERS